MQVRQHPWAGVGVTVHVDALQQVLADQAASTDFSEHWLPEGPLHVIAPEQALCAHDAVDAADCMSIGPEQAESLHVTVHDCVALQAIAAEHAPAAQLTRHVVPPHVMFSEQDFAPHSTSQLAPREQSTLPVQPLSPHCTTHGTPGGQTAPDRHLSCVQSRTQRPLASHAPLGHDWAEQGVAPAAGAGDTTSRILRGRRKRWPSRSTGRA
jgi:hypothetical protein